MKIKEKMPSCSSQSSCSSAGKDGSGCSSCASKGANSQEAQNNAITDTLSRIKHVIFVMSGKGGVGKSSVTVNVAAALAKAGKRVGILDVDIHGPSVPRLLGLTGGLDMDEKGEKLIPAHYMDNLLVLSMDSLLRDKDTAILWRGPKKTAAIRQFISDVEWGDLDYLVIDSPPGTGDEHMTILKAIPQALCLVVTTPQEISLADVRKAINFLQYARMNVLGIVENMSGLVCPHCGEGIALFKQGGGKELATRYGIPFLGSVAIDPVTVVAADTGKPVVLLDIPTQAGKDFTAVALKASEIAETGGAVRLHLPEDVEENE